MPQDPLGGREGTGGRVRGTDSIENIFAEQQLK